MKNTNASCSKCGASVGENMIYCPYCGTLRSEMKKVLDNQIELQFIKDKNDEEIRLQKHAQKMENTKMIFSITMLIIGSSLIILMCLFATGKI